MQSYYPPNVGDYDKRTPLHVAACEGHLDMCQLLLEYGADPNAKDIYGNTPISEA